MISNKKTAWGAKNILLALVLLSLAVAVFYDYFPKDEEMPVIADKVPFSKESAAVKAPEEQWINKKLYARQMQHYKQLIASKKQIHAAYANIALPYAMQMAELGTFHRSKSMNKKQVQQYIKKMLPGDGSINLEKIKIENNKQVDGNQIFIVSIKLKSYTHQSLFNLLNQWGNFHNGLIWENFSVIVDNKQHFSSLTGRLRITFIRSIE